MKMKIWSINYKTESNDCGLVNYLSNGKVKCLHGYNYMRNCTKKNCPIKEEEK